MGGLAWGFLERLFAYVVVETDVVEEDVMFLTVIVSLML